MHQEFKTLAPIRAKGEGEGVGIGEGVEVG